MHCLVTSIAYRESGVIKSDKTRDYTVQEVLGLSENIVIMDGKGSNPHPLRV